MNPVCTRFLYGITLAVVSASALHANWLEDVGYLRLKQTFTSGVPVSVADGVSQAEAGDASGNFYQPDFAHSEFSGKVLTVKSSGAGISGHATPVGVYFYGNTTSLIPATTTIDSYDANGWIHADFLNYGTSGEPLPETRRVQNHSWIGSFSGNDASITNANQRLDFAINRDGFTNVVGMNNGASSTLPDLLGQGYHSLAVGLVNGNHSAGLTAYDVAGRMKPDLVAFESVTSFSTPQVASAAGLISEKLRNTYSASLVTADYPRLTKALLLAGAAKEPLSSWSRADTSKPYDAVYGAGALNILLPYRILVAGKQTASETATVDDTGWNVASVRNTTAPASRTYYFDIPAGTTSTRFSAALTWHRSLTFFSGSFLASLANLDLRLYPVASGTFTLGAQIDASLSTVDNVEHIYQATLAPGRYALQVTSSSGTSTRYALAWRTSPTVTVAATASTAREIDGTAGVFTLTRTGPVTSPLLVPLNWSGTAVSETHYIAPPATVLIPAGSATGTVTITPIADAVAQGDRTVTLLVSDDYSLSAGAAPNATVTIQDKPYDAWRFARFTSEELADATISGPSADPDSDGHPNLMEYALNAEPKTSDSTQHAPTAATTDNHLSLTYKRPDSTTDVAYIVEWSGNLQTWDSGPTVTETVATTSNGDGTTTVTERSLTTMSATPRQFLRLRITLP